MLISSNFSVEPSSKMDLKLDSAIRSGCTCMTCRLVFESVDLQKEHYSSEWHRYNAKRQVADLPPITKEQFESKIKARQEEVRVLICLGGGV